MNSWVIGIDPISLRQRCPALTRRGLAAKNAKMETLKTQIVKCRVSESWYASLESAYLRISSPSGGSIRISKWPRASLKNQWDKDPVVKELVWRVYKDATAPGGDGSVNLSVAEMSLLKSFSDDQNSPARKPKGAARHGHGAACPSCGSGELKVKDHGKWEGYFCPSCGAGGSRQKK